MPDPKPAPPTDVVPPVRRRYPPPPERMSSAPRVRALLTGRMTPEKRTQIDSWLSGILNPHQELPSSPERLTLQQASTLLAAPDRTVNLALRMLGHQYPESPLRSPTLHVAPELDYATSAARVRKTGHLMLNPLELPDYDAKVVTPSSTEWGQKFLGLLDTLRHEYSHGMGLGDWPDQGPSVPDPMARGERPPIGGAHSRPSAYDVSSASERLHEDIELPRDLPPPKKGSR